MKILGYIGVAAGCLAIVFAFAGGNAGLVFLGCVAILCGLVSVTIDDVRKRLQNLEKSVAQLAERSSSAEDIVDQLRQEGMIRAGAPLDEQSIEEILEE
jgi:hypothetical protein